MASKEDNNNERASKRLRSSEPDLRVILGSGEDEVAKWYHSPTLASKSKYIDTMLSTPMRESERHTITFPDIDSKIWDDMMKYLDSPAAARKMNERDVFDVAPFYDKYEFEEGTKLCDQLLSDYFKSLKSMEKDLSLDVDLVVDSLVLAKDANLFGALRRGVGYVWKKMHSEDSPYGRTMFRIDQMKKMVPILVYAFSPENKEKIGTRVSTRIRGVRCNLPYSDKFSIEPLVRWRSPELSLDHPDFPPAYVFACQQKSEEVLLHRSMKQIEVSGVGTADVVFKKQVAENVDECYWYTSTKKVNWGQRILTLVVTRFGGETRQGYEYKDWAIIATNNNDYPLPNRDGSIALEICCWTAPCSANLNFPPQNGWKGVDTLAKGSPKISYMFHHRL